MRKPFDGNFNKTQDWNDKCCRASYSKYGIMGHNGHDFGMPTGTRVLAPHGGKILEAQFDSGYGNYVKIENDKEGSILAHLSKLSVQVGQQLIEGNEVGLSGNTGNSTGPHLHWGYYRLPRNRENGFLGFIDQDDWMSVVYTDPALKQRLEESEKRNGELLSYVKEIKELTIKAGA